jgi:LmbE family N-acetylglucosaminyl deacetylase
MAALPEYDYPVGMLLNAPHSDLLVPDGAAPAAASARTTHLGIGAHPDDLEIMAFPGIAECYRQSDAWFTGVVICDGAGSPRSGPYADHDNAEMIACRREEQRTAARLGEYSLQLQLGYSSAAVKAGEAGIVEDLVTILDACRPTVLYLHNPADAHATHRAVLRACLAALRELEASRRPSEILGVEVWRSLDWLPPKLRKALPIHDPDALQERLLRCHDSQISGGKRYDTAILARQRANATLASGDSVDECSACVLATDLRALVEDPALTVRDWLARRLDAFRQELLAEWEHI